MSVHDDGLLNDLWSFYFHDPFNTDWNMSSYIKVMDIGTVDEFWQVYETFASKFQMGMFFLMREHIFPCWDDPLNSTGGCLSIKVLKQDVPSFWKEMCMRLLGETFLVKEKASHFDNVNGISVSPKKNFCIIKIWLRTHEFANKVFFQLPNGNYGDILYKPNIENMNA